MNFSKKLKEKQEIPNKAYNELYPTGTGPGILWGLWKFHKSIVDGVPPFRPILSAIGTPTYKLAKCFVSLLEPLTHNQHTIKDSFLFCEELKHFNTNYELSNRPSLTFPCKKLLTCVFKSNLRIKIILTVCPGTLFVKC